MGGGVAKAGGVTKSPLRRMLPLLGPPSAIRTRVTLSEPGIDVEVEVELVVEVLEEDEELDEEDEEFEEDDELDEEELDEEELDEEDELELEVEVEVLLVVVVGEQGVPAASAVRNGVKSTLAVTLSHPALPGPAAHPHQLFSAAPSVFIEAAVRSFTPNGALFPAKLLLLIDVKVVANESSAIRMAPNGTTGHSAG